MTNRLDPNVPLLQAINLEKQFPRVKALDDVSVDFYPGEIHCLLGENGAGKSTLAETFYGTYRPDAGSIHMRGGEVTISEPRDAIELGIGMIHQDFVLVPTVSVIENIFVGSRSSRILLDLRGANARVEALCSKYGIEIDPKAKVSQLAVGEQQWVEILKALYTGVDVLILDEPTAILTPQEAETLFTILKEMRDEGLCIIFITHKLREVMSISGRVTVLRNGKVVGTLNTSDATEVKLARMMVGREVVFRLAKEEVAHGEVSLQIENLHALHDKGHEALKGVSLSIRNGEIVGLAGVAGNGQRELFETLIGVRPATAGKVMLDGEDITNNSPQAIQAKGMGSIPEDKRDALAMTFGVDENLILGLHRKRPFARGSLLLNLKEVEAFAQEAISNFNIMTPSIHHPTHVLSGGNLQRVILARELSQSPSFLIADKPTRGLDVGATEYVRKLLLEQRKRGVAVLLISEDLDEILQLSDRIAVIFKGQIMAVLDAAEATIKEIGLLMAGAQEVVPS